jgi:hypothetical protein
VFANLPRGQVGRRAETGWQSALGNFICVFMGIIPFVFLILCCYIWAGASPCFGTRTNVFLSGKAEIAAETRQVSIVRETDGS